LIIPSIRIFILALVNQLGLQLVTELVWLYSINKKSQFVYAPINFLQKLLSA